MCRKVCAMLFPYRALITTNDSSTNRPEAFLRPVFLQGSYAQIIIRLNSREQSSLLELDSVQP